MRSNGWWTALVLGCVVWIGSAGSGAERVDPFMGDWQGTYETLDGDVSDFVAQVIALGDSRYRVNNLYAFDTREAPICVVEGELRDGRVRLTSADGFWRIQGVLEGDTFSGTFRGEADGRFELHRVVRLSPTLGARPPRGAIVLFDGTGFEEWRSVGFFAGLVDLAHEIGGDHAAAYLKTRLWSMIDQPAVLEIGSDDGVKVWLNGQVVHANNAARGVTPGQDKVPVQFRTGWNDLLLKVTNGAGGWGACVRVADAQGRPLKNVHEQAADDETAVTRQSFVQNNAFLTTWSVAGPYRVEGKEGSDLLDIPLGPELKDPPTDWKTLKLPDSTDEVPWPIVDGAMQVGRGSIVTRRTFSDFRMHLEFRTPFMPTARGQGRANSGVYLQGRYEVQVLDSYGLEGADNECGGIYQVARPAVNMCAPPLQWQTYDIDFRAPRFDDEGRKTAPAILTLRHNGVTIHNSQPLPGPTGGALDGNEHEPGGIMLQDHGNPVQYRNIWIIPAPSAAP